MGREARGARTRNTDPPCELPAGEQAEILLVQAELSGRADLPAQEVRLRRPDFRKSASIEFSAITEPISSTVANIARISAT